MCCSYFLNQIFKLNRGEVTLNLGIICNFFWHGVFMQILHAVHSASKMYRQQRGRNQYSRTSKGYNCLHFPSSSTNSRQIGSASARHTLNNVGKTGNFHELFESFRRYTPKSNDWIPCGIPTHEYLVVWLDYCDTEAGWAHYIRGSRRIWTLYS